MQRIMYYHFSSITLKVKTNGYNYIYYHNGCSNAALLPDEIYINKINQSIVTYMYNLSINDNITLIWKIPVTILDVCSISVPTLLKWIYQILT